MITQPLLKKTRINFTHSYSPPFPPYFQITLSTPSDFWPIEPLFETNQEQKLCVTHCSPENPLYPIHSSILRALSPAALFRPLYRCILTEQLHLEGKGIGNFMLLGRGEGSGKTDNTKVHWREKVRHKSGTSSNIVLHFDVVNNVNKNMV